MNQGKSWYGPVNSRGTPSDALHKKTEQRGREDPVTWALGFILFLIGLTSILSIIVGSSKIGSGQEPSGTECTSLVHKLITVNIWIVVYGVIVAVMLAFLVLDYCYASSMDSKTGMMVASQLWLVWGTLGLFIIWPWTIIGQVLLLPGTFCAVSGAYPVAIIDLITSYLLGAGAIACMVSKVFSSYKDTKKGEE